MSVTMEQFNEWWPNTARPFAQEGVRFLREPLASETAKELVMAAPDGSLRGIVWRPGDRALLCVCGHKLGDRTWVPLDIEVDMLGHLVGCKGVRR